ncbi:hypothetical protein P167DRAFT_326021 [Morchella conica CCBAS932]|uniref:Uncharacterized protein n=1 Tax=Morchella conica CCBAS932 TaxID=1392247 RepID=A0A3N4KTB0_9PEZI|nr:hypothetical protein P167DRAFT_326021 [Morchella conica CCBAS932]
MAHPRTKSRELLSPNQIKVKESLVLYVLLLAHLTEKATCEYILLPRVLIWSKDLLIYKIAIAYHHASLVQEERAR